MHIQRGLNPAVLSTVPVEGEKDHIRGAAQVNHSVPKQTGTLIFSGPAHLLQIGRLPGHLPPLGRDRGVIEGLQGPVIILQPHKQVGQSDPVPSVPQGLGHHSAGGEGYIALPAQTAG